MTLTPRRHEYLSVGLLGIGTLFMYLGYHTQSFITEAVIHSVHSQHPERISQYAGYYGQAIHYTAFAVSSLFTASLQHYLASKWILVLATVLFSLYHVGFIYINSYYFYLSQILMGLAYSLYNNGEGAYLAEHSSRKTLEANTGVETAIGHTSMFVGGLALCAIFYFIPQNAFEAASHSRTFSQEHIWAIYGTFFTVSVLAVIIFALLPTKQIDSIASNSPRIIPSLKDQFKNMGRTFLHPNMCLLSVTYLYFGFLVSFFLGIYPTTLSFTNGVSRDVYIVALYSVFAGLAELTAGMYIRPLMKKCRQYKLIFVIFVHILSTASALILIFLSVPDESTIRPTEQRTLLLTPSRWLACVIGYLLGLSDFTLTLGRAVICQVAIPNSRAEVFSLTRFFQCISACTVLFLSPYMGISIWLIVLSIGLICGSICFTIVVRRTILTSDSVAPSDEITNDEQLCSDEKV